MIGVFVGTCICTSLIYNVTRLGIVAAGGVCVVAVFVVAAVVVVVVFAAVVNDLRSVARKGIIYLSVCLGAVLV